MIYQKPGKKTPFHGTSYFLSPQQLEELQKKYGRPGEMAPGRPAPRKRKRLDARLSAMDKKEKNLLDLDEDDAMEPLIH